MTQLTLPYLKITLREDATEYQRNLIEDLVMLGLDIENYHIDDDGHLYINIDANDESSNGVIVNAFNLGVLYERLEARYGVQNPFTFTRVVDEEDTE